MIVRRYLSSPTGHKLLYEMSALGGGSRILTRRPTTTIYPVVGSSVALSTPFCATSLRSFTVSASEETDISVTTTSSNEIYQLSRRSRVRNVAVIAHVDHGKTTLVDKLLKAADKDAAQTDRLLDSGDLEKERGITITSKVTRIALEDVTINCADTPGHSDFSGEVDRFLSLSDGFILVVDAAEGPKSQTKYVLTRALALGLKPIVVFNKCDRPDAIQQIDSGATEKKLQALFEQLTNGNKDVSYLALYASAREGWVTEDPLEALELTESGLTNPEEHGMKRLLDHVLEQVPEPHTRYFGETTVTETEAQEGTFFEGDKFSMATVTVGNDQYLGRTCTGRILSGSIGIGDKVSVLPRTSTNAEQSLSPPTEIAGIFVFKGISRTPYEDRAYAGDIVTLAGVPTSVGVGDTLTSWSNPVEQPIFTPPLAPPTLSMDFGANDGPLAGKEGTEVTSSKIRARLMAEADNNITLRIEPSPNDAEKTTVYARGELQLGILIETMRREGYEMIIMPPTILTKIDPKTKKTLEPWEEVTVDVDTEYSGNVIGALTGDRKGIVVSMDEAGDGKTQITFHVPSKGLLGFSNEIANATRGSAVVNHLFLEDREQVNLGAGLTRGKLVATEVGKATGYALSSISARGTLFVEPGEMLYAGMVIGENSKAGDLEVNAVRTKAATNIRSKSMDEKVSLPPSKKMTIEELIGYMESDEILEITPKSVRLRKAILDPDLRKKAARSKSQRTKAATKK